MLKIYNEDREVVVEQDGNQLSSIVSLRIVMSVEQALNKVVLKTAKGEQEVPLDEQVDIYIKYEMSPYGVYARNKVRRIEYFGQALARIKNASFLVEFDSALWTMQLELVV